MTAKSYFVIWCERDTSFSLVHHSSVICEESVNVGDEVKFFVSSKEYQGTVRAVGDDYDEMKRIQDKLNSEKPKAPSFHAERKRTSVAPLRYRTATDGSSSNPNKSKRSSVSKMRKKSLNSPRKHGVSPHKNPKGLMSVSAVLAARRAKGEKQMLLATKTPREVDSGDESSTDNDIISMPNRGTSPKRKALRIYTSSDNDQETLTSEEKALLQKLQAKDAAIKAKADAKALKALAAGHMEDNVRSVQDNEVELGHVEGGDKSVDDLSRKVEADEGQPNGKGSPNGLPAEGEDSDTDTPIQPLPKKSRQDKTISYEGVQFSFDLPDAKKNEFSELKGPKGKGLGVHCDDVCLSKARRLARTASAYARKLMVGVFTADALSACTVSGDLYKAGGRDKQTRKPKLCDKAVDAIIDAAMARQTKKGWSPSLNATNIKDSLRQKLVDFRIAKETPKKPAKTSRKKSSKESPEGIPEGIREGTR